MICPTCGQEIGCPVANDGLYPCQCGETFRPGGLYLAGNDATGYAIRCPACKAIGPIRRAEASAVEAWNTRSLRLEQ